MRVRKAHNSSSWKGHGIGLRVKGDQMRVPLKPTPDLIFFRLRQRGIYPVREDADGVGFETMCYYLIINTIKDLYCAVLREIATTCNLAVTNCHGIYFPHFQSEILPKLLSPFEIKIISIRPPGFETRDPHKATLVAD